MVITTNFAHLLQALKKSLAFLPSEMSSATITQVIYSHGNGFIIIFMLPAFAFHGIFPLRRRICTFSSLFSNEPSAQECDVNDV